MTPTFDFLSAEAKRQRDEGITWKRQYQNKSKEANCVFVRNSNAGSFGPGGEWDYASPGTVIRDILYRPFAPQRGQNL